MGVKGMKKTDVADDRRDEPQSDSDRYVFGHDVSNEMMTIIGHVELARSRIMSGNGNALDDLAEIEAAAKRAVARCRELVCRLSSAVRGSVEGEKKKESGLVTGLPPSKMPLLEGRVLLVDDESSVRAVARQMLERIGFDVESAVDGLDALEQLEKDPERFTCVLLDISMPGMNGDDCFFRLRRLRPDIPVLFSSGNADKALAEPLVESPLTTFIQKPYSMAVLRREIQTLLSSVPGF